MDNHSALFYPYIDMRDAGWFKAMSMFYEHVYRIVPAGVTTNDPDELKPLIESQAIGKQIDPGRYAADTAEKFLQKIQEWDAAALSASDAEEYEVAKLHTGKTDQVVRDLFNKLGYPESEDWHYLPTEFASNYMLFLAREIASRNKLSLATSEWAPWTATSYFNMDGGISENMRMYDTSDQDGQEQFALFSFIVSRFIPLNIQDIPSNKLVDFRERRRDEISRLRQAIADFHEHLSGIEEEEIVIDEINQKVKELESALQDYRKSADLFKVNGWFGINLMGFPAAYLLGKLLGAPDASIAAIIGSGIAVGGIYNINKSRSELRKLRKESPVSCLVEMEESFKGYTQARGGGDMNYHAYNCLEEYEND
ncbi:MAG: hypothetical protein HQL73_11425 [Magnetococcales bacterium]|nr:hypothetical protein [Magnetococcales bacterium]